MVVIIFTDCHEERDLEISFYTMNIFLKPNFEYSNEIHLSRMGGEGQDDNTKNPCTKKFLNCYLMIKKKINKYNND